MHIKLNHKCPSPGKITFPGERGKNLLSRTINVGKKLSLENVEKSWRSLIA